MQYCEIPLSGTRVLYLHDTIKSQITKSFNYYLSKSQVII